jgi:ATP-dependent Lhr-like helicase
LLLPRPNETLLTEVLGSLNASELARRRFPRDRARVGPDLPEPSQREAQQQAAAGLVVAVLRGVSQVRPGNRPADAGRAGSCCDELDIQRLADSLARMQGQQLVLRTPARPRHLRFR